MGRISPTYSLVVLLTAPPWPRLGLVESRRHCLKANAELRCENHIKCDDNNFSSIRQKARQTYQQKDV
jgi:hypothetical protein